MSLEKRKSRDAIVIALTAILLVAVFALCLFASLVSVGAENREIKTSQNSPTGLVSAGAPRSQLALKQMFDAMSITRTNGSRVIYEPITEEYLAAVSERIEKGEKPSLSVEEILYIISDSMACLEKYDGVKLHGEGTVIFKKDSDSRPPHITALENSRAVFDIIIYRIKNLCYDSSFKTDGDGVEYYPEGEANGDKKFVFTRVSDDQRGENIVFFPGDGQRIVLYPMSDSTFGDLKYMLQSEAPLSDFEREILEKAGYSPDRCRNVTPTYWKGLTDCKLVIVGGRIVIVDPENRIAADSAPTDMRTVSFAAGDADGDKEYELYFTAYSDGKSCALIYLPDEGKTEVLFESDDCLGAYEDLEGKGVSFYRVEQIESGSYLNLLRRVGDEIDK